MDRFSAETYVLTGPLRNFSIRVKLFRQQTKAEEQNLEEEYVFHWQEKIFSPKEKALYRDRKNCMTETQLLYNEEMNRISQMNKVSGFLLLEKSVSYLLIVILVGATNFENPGLYVQYYLELPQNWKAYDHRLLCGSSQIASVKNHGNEKISIFSHPIEFDLTYKPEISIGLTKGSVSIWPTLYFEVMSLDFWTRSRTEGYGFTELPRIAGTHSIGVSCWRPVGDSVVEELRRFFTGGTCQLEDPTFTKIPGSFESTNLVKYGFRSRSTGKLFLRLNCAVQSWSNLYRAVNRCTITGDEKQRAALAHMDVSTIIKAYQKARSKLLETRKVIEGLEKLNL
ncbi:unnamed protein product [Schistosoma turkestanicum]|nr:unnamed protein product [Schistosoma turkestanicum]